MYKGLRDCMSAPNLPDAQVLSRHDKKLISQFGNFQRHPSSFSIKVSSERS